MTVQVCTIIARNYLPRARVLANSVREHHPLGRVSVLVIDDVYAEVDGAEEPFEVVRPADIGLAADEFHRMAMIYDIVELATSLKPWLLQHLLDRDGAAPAIYLDPDVRVYDRLDEVLRFAAAHGIVLTPHVTAPIPRDGKMTDENTILSAGMYNLGFIAVSRQAQPFLRFWMERLRRDCTVDPANNRFVDQRWVDFVPSLFDCHILREPSYNVAYWNLDHRELRWGADGYRVDGQPLRFFHYSGFDADVPSLLSRWQGERPRILLTEHPDLARICADYAAELRASTRPGEGDVPYGLAELPNGVPIQAELRQLYRARLVAAERDGLAAPADPFLPEGAEELLTWACTGPQGPGHRLSPYLEFLHQQRADLRGAFAHPEGRDYEAYLDWAEHEAAAGRVHPRLVTATRCPRLDWSGEPGAAPAPTAQEHPELLLLAGSRADPASPSRFSFLSRLIRRVVARLTAHGEAHRAAVDVRLAEAILHLEARLDEVDRRLGVRASSAYEPLSVPSQLAALDAHAVDRLGRLDVRFRLLSERLGRRVEHLAQAVDELTATPAVLVPAEAATQLQVIDGASPRESDVASRVANA